MGFGYNPDLRIKGERLDILDYFSWMKQISGYWIIWDASGYAIVNRARDNKFKTIPKNGKDIIDFLITEQDRPKKFEFRENCDLRKKYLNNLIEISEIDGKYLDAREVFRRDLRYADALDFSLEFTDRLKVDKPDLVAKIFTTNSLEVSQLYLPLEIAEALYLQQNFDVDTKFGPETEKYFDSCIMGQMKELGISYATEECPLGPNKPGYLSENRSCVYTSSGTDFIAKALKDEQYSLFLKDSFDCYRKENEPLVKSILRIQALLNGDFP